MKEKMWYLSKVQKKKKKNPLTAQQERNLLILLWAQSEHEDFPARRNNSFHRRMGEQVGTQ